MPPSRARSTPWGRIVALGLVLLLVLGVLAGGAHFADQLTAEPTYRPVEGEQDNEVLAADADTVTLRDEGFLASTDGTATPEPTRWGLQLPDDRHVVLTGVVARDETAGTVTWGWTDATGAPPEVGEQVRVDEFVAVGTPAAVGLEHLDVVVDGPVGPLPTWVVPSTGATDRGTVVFVHGRGGTLEESLRFLPTLASAGWDVVVPTYRGDAAFRPDAPPWPDGRVRFGVAAWADLEAVVADALSTDGAVPTAAADEPLVLFGVSMGGAIAAQFLDRSDLADEVDAVVLDSPVLSLDDLLVLQGELNGVPGPLAPVLLPIVQAVADLRYDLDSASIEQVAVDGTFDVPVLLVHGDDDAFVPVSGSVRFAEARIDGMDPARPDGPTLLRSADGRTTFLRVPTAGHVRTTNVAPTRYAEVLSEFLQDLG